MSLLPQFPPLGPLPYMVKAQAQALIETLSLVSNCLYKPCIPAGA